LLITSISVKNSLVPCLDSAERTFTAISCMLLVVPWNIDILSCDARAGRLEQKIWRDLNPPPMLPPIRTHKDINIYLIYCPKATSADFIGTVEVVCCWSQLRIREESYVLLSWNSWKW
jgi:hypothetical protein